MLCLFTGSDYKQSSDLNAQWSLLPPSSGVCEYLRVPFPHYLSISGAPELKSSITKGQLISEQIYAVLDFPKMQQNIARISALASKMGQIKKSIGAFLS